MGIVKNKNSEKIRRLVTLAILTALIIVLQIISNYIKFGPVQITLALAPMIIGTALYGAWAGAFLGAMLGVVILISGLIGIDGGFMMILLNANPFFAVAVCILKTTVAGFSAGLIYNLIEKKNSLVATFASGIICPVVNTGLFILAMATVFIETLRSFAGDTDILTFVMTAFVGVNFLIELAVNLILGVAIARIIRAVKK